MSGKKDEKFEEDEEEEDKKYPPNLQVSPSNPDEGNKKGRATLVYNEVVEVTKKSSMESLDHEKAHREFAQKDVETIEMEEGFFCAEWEKFNEATDGHVPISNPNERGVKNEARTTTHGSSGGRRAASSPRGTDASSGAEAVDSRAHPPNNAQRRIITLPPTRPGAQRVPGPDSEGRDEDEDQMTFVSHEETDFPYVPEAEPVNPEKDRQAAIDDFIATAPVADVVPDVIPDAIPEMPPDNKGRRRKVVGALLLVSMIAIVVGAVLGSRPDDEETMSQSEYEALLSSVSSDGGEALGNSSTPQYMAFNWTVTNNEAYSDEQIIQRYALATIFFSTNGDSWDDNTGWLSEDECTWYGVNCTSSGAVSVLDLFRDDTYSGNNLEGTLPPEIGLLSRLAYLYLGINKLSGMIPSEIGMVSDSLEFLSFWKNTLEGTIPSELGKLAKLTWLDLSDNKLSGTIPSEIKSLVNLESLYLGGNNFTGNYTCPKSINHCGISCNPWSNNGNNYTDECRVL